MRTENFIGLTETEMLCLDGGGWFGNVLIAAGGIVGLAATGPVAVGVGIACVVIGFCDAQDW